MPGICAAVYSLELTVGVAAAGEGALAARPPTAPEPKVGAAAGGPAAEEAPPASALFPSSLYLFQCASLIAA